MTEEQTTQAESKDQKLTSEQEINVLGQVHVYLSNFDGIKGSQAASFSRTLDGLALVVNSLVLKFDEAKKAA
jgi:hypothetical protein